MARLRVAALSTAVIWGGALISGLATAMEAPLKLSDWPFYGSSKSAYRAGFEYSLKQPAFSDYARKVRTIHLPLGSEVRVNAQEGFVEYPVGTVVEKQFFYLTRHKKDCLANGSVKAVQGQDYEPAADRPAFQCKIETRLLRKEQHGWEPLVYVWDASQKEAQLTSGGGSVPVVLQSDKETVEFTYQIPSLGDCAQCHWGALGVNAGFDLIGPSLIRRLDLASIKMHFPTSLLSQENISALANATLASQAREYLDINCAHCHNPQGLAASSALFLGLDQPLDTHFGLCKRVIASGTDYTGNIFTIVPGKPSQSILISRMSSNQPKVKMPELGRAVIDESGVDLIGNWIATLQGDCQSEV